MEGLTALILWVILLGVLMPDSGSDSVECLTPKMKKALNDPRNSKFWSWLLTQRNLPKGTILIDETGLVSWKVKE